MKGTNKPEERTKILRFDTHRDPSQLEENKCK